MSATNRYSTIQAILIAASIGGYPLIATLPIAFDTETQTFTIPYRAAVVFATLLFVFFWVRDGHRVIRSKFWMPFTVFWILYSARLFYELVIADNTLGFKPQEYLLFTYGITLLPTIAFAFPPAMETLQRARQWTFLICVVALLGNFAVGWEFIFAAGFSRFGTESLNAVSFAALGTVTILLGAINLVADPQRVGTAIALKNLVRSTYVIGIFIGAAAIYLSGSRGPMLTTLVCLVLLFWIAGHAKLTNLIWFTPIALVAIALMLLSDTETFASRTLFERLRSIGTLEDQSDTDRLALWEGGLEQFLASPAFGSGLEEQSFLFYPHNLPLEAFMSTGVMGGICFLAVLLISLFHALRLLAEPAQYAWFGIVYIALTMMALFAGSIWGAGSLIHFMVGVVALSKSLQQSRNSLMQLGISSRRVPG